MLEHGLLERRAQLPTIAEVIAYTHTLAEVPPDLVVCGGHQKLREGIELMQQYGISQLPVVRGQAADTLAGLIGSLNERGLLDRIFQDPNALDEEVAQAMDAPLHAVDARDSVGEVFTDLTRGGSAVVVVSGGSPTVVLTRSDLLEYFVHGRTPTP
jgi:cystathionine beta-synthase